MGKNQRIVTTTKRFEQARKAPTTHDYDYIDSYARDLGKVVDMEAIPRKIVASPRPLRFALIATRVAGGGGLCY